MKRILLITASLTMANIFFADNIVAQQPLEFLNANEVNAGMGIGGNLFSEITSHDSVDETLLYEVPQGTNKRAIFTASLWLSALDSISSLHGAGQTYNGGGYYDGPVSNTYDSVYDNYYHRVFKVTQAQINYDRTLTFPANPAALDSSILLWPGKGNTFVASVYGVNIISDMAPFVDLDNDGVYNPLNGDYPAICGSAGVFFVFNDDRETHSPSGCSKLGVEVRGLAYEYMDLSSTEFAYGKRAINNTVFVQYDIENKSQNSYNNFYLSLWEDPDLGCYDNDRVGSDTNRNLMFVYNGTTPDLTCQTEAGYFPYQASHGIIMLNQKMSDFVYFTNGNVPATTDPQTCPQFRNYMTGYWADGTPFTTGGTGYGGTHPTKFVFPGDPNDTTQWSEMSVTGSLPAGDRRMVGSGGGMNFNSGEIKHFDLAFTTSYDSTTATFLSIVDTLKRDADIVQAFYNNNVVPCRNGLTLGINQVNNNGNFNISIFPNPANSQITIEADANIQTLIMTDMTGRMVMQQKANSKNMEIDVSSLAKGVYLLKVESGNWEVVKKVVVE